MKNTYAVTAILVIWTVLAPPRALAAGKTLEEVWMREGGARLYYDALVRPRQMNANGARVTDPAFVNLPPLQAPAKPRRSTPAPSARKVPAPVAPVAPKSPASSMVDVPGPPASPAAAKPLGAGSTSPPPAAPVVH